MKIFVDTNVIIDYLADRAPFADDAEAVIDVCVSDGNEGAFSGLSACNGLHHWKSDRQTRSRVACERSREIDWAFAY